jgi:hypothetical protein
MKRSLFIMMLVSIFHLFAGAQSLRIKGQVLSGKSPVEYANIVLQTADSTFITGGITDELGRFKLENVSSGHYQLNVSSIGYTSKNVNLSPSDHNIDLGVIQIDSSAIALKEVIVKASHIINQADKKIILPTAYQIKASTNGLSLLQQLKLSRLHVDQMRNTITSSAQGDVQLRINGSKVQIQEIRALRPTDIERIEYHEDPSMRYGENVAVVIDYITKKPTSGGYVGLDTQNSPFSGFGNNGLNVKLNHDKSEFGMYYWGMYRSFGGYWRQNSETFNFADKSSFTRLEEGIPNRFIENHHYSGLYYNYQEGQKWFVNANARFGYDSNNTNCESLLYPINNKQNSVDMLDRSKYKNNSPSVDVYFQRNYSKKRTLVLDVVGTYINSHNQRNYSETKDKEVTTDILSRVKGEKYSVIAEAIYEKGIGKKDKISFGARYNQSYSNNQYLGTITSLTNMKEGRASVYTEYMGNFGKFNYSAGAHLAYEWFDQKDNNYEKVLFCPEVKIKYNFSDRTYLRLTGKLDYNSPQISDLSNVEQLIDSLQIRRGNPNLKVVSVCSNNLYFETGKGLFTGSFNLFYQYQDKPIMEETLRENDKFVRTIMNQHNWQKVNPEMELKFGPIKNILNLSLTTGMNYFDSRGIDYRHSYTNWYYELEASAMYKNLTAMFQIQNHKNDFYGETLTYGENFHILMLGYKLKNVNIGLMTLNPFSGKNSYNRPTENYNKLAPARNTWFLRESSRLYVITASWNFSFGRKYNAEQKKLNNTDTDTGTLKSGK